MAGDEKKGEDRLRAVSFAAGTAAFMACIERAFVVSVFMHWRVWAFLALNLLLLAILFTSKSQIPSTNDEVHNQNGEDAEIKKCKKRRHQPQPVLAAAAEPPSPPQPAVADTGEIEGKVEDYDELSEEELKQRVEDFIAMFRQHLICDAKGVKIMGSSNAIAPRVY